MSARLFQGDCLQVMADMAAAGEQVDSIVTDPPYHLTSIVERFGKANSAPAKSDGETGVYARASRGFMGKTWDGGDIAQRVELWDLAYALLKPGGHMLAFSGTRTQHRMVCAIEDAGFEVRDQIGWMYGSGFPKSLDVSKAIDKHGGVSVAWFGPWFRKWREENCVTQKQVAALFPSKTGGLTGCVANWELGLNMPTPDQFNLIRDTFGLPFDSIAAAEREVVGKSDKPKPTFHTADIGGEAEANECDITAPSTPEAQQWAGWGTALKPAWEPICVARKPLIGTVAANVLAHGTGAINIDGCRVGTTRGVPASLSKSKSSAVLGLGVTAGTERELDPNMGRWPANVVHDGSDEVLAAFAAFGESKSSAHVRHNGDFKSVSKGKDTAHETRGVVDQGTAARFFYSSKAGKADRADSKHPTVKPLSLMRYLCKLVTPPGGTVLDMFAGSGTTLQAAIEEGFNAIGIEREDEYVNDIKRRLGMEDDVDAILAELLS